MRIAIVGPTSPYKGGIAQETTELAHRLQAAGHSVEVVSWKVMYPKLLYPGDQFVPSGKGEGRLFANASRQLDWKNPAGWWRQGRRLRNYDHVIFVWWVPTFQGPAYLTMLKALGATNTSLVAHNVLPHEPRPGDKVLTKAVFSRVGQIITHTDELAQLAQKFTAKPVIVVPLPLALPGSGAARRPAKLTHQLLFFGIVRPYKGLDVLLRALAQTTDVKLHIAGEIWDLKSYQKLIAELDLTKRVSLQAGYVSDNDLPELFAASDALVLPYRSGTGSQHVAIAHSYGLPVIATSVPAFAKQIRHGYDGLLCQPDDDASLARAITEFYKPGVAQKLQRGIPKLSADQQWADYVAACIGISSKGE